MHSIEISRYLLTHSNKFTVPPKWYCIVLDQKVLYLNGQEGKDQPVFIEELPRLDDIIDFSSDFVIDLAKLWIHFYFSPHLLQC